MTRNNLIVAVCLAGIVLALLIVGIVSSTLLRHIVQVVPAIIALAAVARRAAWGWYAAFPIFIFWFAIMLLIWLYLLGVTQIVSGRFTPIEIICTLIIGVCCVCGAVVSFRALKPVNRLSSLLIFILFAALQVSAMWLSFRPSISRD